MTELVVVLAVVVCAVVWGLLQRHAPSSTSCSSTSCHPDDSCAGCERTSRESHHVP